MFFSTLRLQALRCASLTVMGLLALAVAEPRTIHAEAPRTVASTSDYSALVKIIEGSPGKPAPRNLAELLPRLSLDLRSNFTLVYDSRSPHGNPENRPAGAVDPLHPRVVLFTPDARLMVAFTGNPAKSGYDVIETIRFDDQTSTFTTASFFLPDAIRKDPSLRPLARQNGAPNLPACTRCHGADPRPIFDSYNVWPGFYGSMADQPALNPKEHTNYRHFLATNKDRPDLPYRFLKWRRTSPIYPFTDSDSKTLHPLTSAKQLALLPNTRLGMALTELNRARLFRKIKLSPGYDRWRFALLAGFAGCGSLPLTDEFQAEVQAQILRENDAKIARTGMEPRSPIALALTMQELDPELKRGVAELAYLSGALSVPHDDWSMAFEPGSHSFFDGILSGIANGQSFYLKEDLMLGMLGDLAAENADFAPFTATFNPFDEAGVPFGNRLDLLHIGGNERLCKLLESGARKIGATELPISESAWLANSPFAEFTPPAPLTPLPGKPSTQVNPFGKCIHCHNPAAGSRAALAIPFGDLSALRDILLKPSHNEETPLYVEVLKRILPGSARRMPMASPPLAPEEQRQIENWVHDNLFKAHAQKAG